MAGDVEGEERGGEGGAEGAEGGVVVRGDEVGGGGEELDELEAVVEGCEVECCATLVVLYGEGAAARHEVLRSLQIIPACSAVKSCLSTTILLVELCIPHLNQQLNHFLVPIVGSVS